MSIGAFAEPLVVIALLFGGVYVNRNTSYKLVTKRHGRRDEKPVDETWEIVSDGTASPISRDDSAERGLLTSRPWEESRWRTREVGIGTAKWQVTSPNTEVFRDYYLSRLLIKYPFLVEVWYWALIYWVYQLGRAVGALTLVEGTVNVARHHALQVIHLERRLRIFWEPAVQQAFMRHEATMHWINRIYSFIHIPGTIFFLAWLYRYTTARNRGDVRRQSEEGTGELAGSPPGAHPLFQARRRTMAVCNLLAFIVFTAWPCMPPRLLSDPSAGGADADEGRTYGFVDTVHGKGGESSVWTQNKFCNQYAAMPSLHFGYSLLIGLTVASIPLSPQHRRSRTVALPLLGRVRLPSPRRLACVAVGLSYPTLIFVAIVATANHFILDAVAGACVCAAAWRGNHILLNLLPVEDYFLWCVRIRKP